MICRLLRGVKRPLKTFARSVLRIKNVMICGVKICINYPEIEPLKHYFYDRTYEQDELKILRKVINSSDRVMELGAGVGLLSTYAAQRVGSDNVIAYEANPNLIPIIKNTYRLNSVNPTLRNVIVSDKIGETSFFVNELFWSSSLEEGRQGKEITVSTVDVNNEVSDFTPSLLIVDIEGGEKQLFTQLELANSTIRKIVIELHPHVIGDDECFIIITKLINSGFSLSTELSTSSSFYFYRA